MSAYIYYKDAACTDGSYIKGQFIYAYDHKRMSGKGFKIQKYYGPCKYFEGGKYDFMYGDRDGKYMRDGYCIR